LQYYVATTTGTADPSKPLLYHYMWVGTFLSIERLHARRRSALALAKIDQQAETYRATIAEIEAGATHAGFVCAALGPAEA
jgi:hypothetical protein